MRAKKPDDPTAELKKEGYLPKTDVPAQSRPDDEKMADEALSIRLLAGFDVDKSENVAFPKNFGAEERKLRAALARTIREQMRGPSAELLALAIDPFTPSTWPHMRPTRKIRFVNPGQQSKLMIEKQVVDFICRLRFNSTQERDQKFYITAAMDKFDLKYSRVHAIWHIYETMLKAASTK
jgi:hypothetical protein